jgi:hypothetical protein
MKELSDILAKASAAIEYQYFLVPIFEGNPVQRERVYCYELYHQMRCIWPNGSDFILNGELDKGGHPKLKQKLGPLKPDFLVHHPGRMDLNYAVIEVKPAWPSKKAIRKDVKSISKLIREANYQRGIYLIYGGSEQGRVDRMVDFAKEHTSNTQIEVWLHSYAGGEAKKVAVL